MRTGGAGTLPAQALDEELEFLAANISVSFGVESGVATLDVLKKDLERGLELFADVLRRPRFEPRRIDLAKLQALEAIRRRHDQPQSIVSREFTKLLYGAEHPFARETSTQSIKAITRDDLVAFHRQFVQPHGMILGITGDFQRREILSLLGALFGDWTAGRAPELTLPAVSTAPGSLVRYIAKGTTQTHIRAGHLTMREDDPDYPAMVLLNDILGGGSFRSRLFQDIRTRRGLAYSIGSVVRAGTHARGIWAMRTETKTASTAEVISRLMANMERLREQPVSDQELAEAKDAFVNSFVFSFATPAAIVNRRVQLEYDGLPADFMQRLRDAVVALTAEDLLRVARRHLHPDQLTILTVGPAEAATSLAAFGEVKEIMLPPEG
jgi:predicted Zn-dependent peptidase